MPIIQENISLKPYNTFSIAVKARYFVEIFSEEELKAFLNLATGKGAANACSWWRQ